MSTIIFIALVNEDYQKEKKIPANKIVFYISTYRSSLVLLWPAEDAAIKKNPP